MLSSRTSPLTLFFVGVSSRGKMLQNNASVSDTDSVKREKCVMFIALKTTLEYQTNTNGQIFRNKILYLLPN